MNTLSLQPIILLAGIVLFMLIDLPLSYYSLVKSYGRPLANRLMPRTVATGLLIAIVLALAIFVSTDIDTLLSILFLGLAIFWWGSVITLRFTRSNEPKILLDLGAPFQVSSGMITLLSVIGIGLIVLAPIIRHLYYFFWGLSTLA